MTANKHLTLLCCVRPPHALPLQATSYVSRRRLDSADFDANAVDEEGVLLV